jgi:hypothetical protein
MMFFSRPADEAEQALELSICVLSPSASTQEAKDRAGQLRVEPEARLAPEQIAVDRGRAQTKTFDALMAEKTIML